MSGMTDVSGRIAAIQQMATSLGFGGAPAAPTGDFASSLQSAQNASGTAATTPVSSVSGMPYATEITAAATKYGIDPALLAGLVKQESGFNPNARSGAGAGGLTQLMPATAKSLGVTDVTDPAQALDGGAKYLKQMLDKFGGDERLALAAYNAGPGAVTRFGGVPPYAETQAYVTKVLANRDSYAKSGISADPTAATALPVGAATTTSASALGGSTTLNTLRTALDSPSTTGTTGSSSGLGYPTT